MAEVTETARARVQKLLTDWDWPDPAILEDILALGAGAVPALEEFLTPKLLADALGDERADALVYYAMELLAALETPAAIPSFVAAYRQVDDDMVEGMEHALLRFGPEALEPLLDVAADGGLTWYARSLAANGARHAAAEDPARRARLAERLRGVVADYVARPEPLSDEEKDVVASFISDLADLADPEARPLIEAAFDAGRVLSTPTGRFDLPIIRREDVEETYREGGHSEHWDPPPFLDDYRKRRLKHFEDEEKKKRLAAFNQKAAPQPVVLDPKLGRNDPCWCGSGKKYKKCHLAQDEKDRVRL